ncbi:MAG: type II toxin-antitoxin system HigB family toxin [Ferruginibacter sp.]
MQVLNILILQNFAKKHSDSQKSISTWRKIVNEAKWESKQQVLSDFPNAKAIKGNRARFKITHNRYQLIAEILYKDEIVIIRFIGTHKEYDNIDPVTVAMKP